MNIQQAKQEIANTLRAYLSRDELGNYRIPSVRQRPILLMGPPGVGKTQIMEQVAAESGVGLVAYTITHHTRQSAVGLPFIEKRTYGGQEFTVTEYTMSEILASVYNLMERTGLREGILFLDEINCVSETLTPMMLQFLQCKTFGNQRLPEGWLIVAAGNPPEYNRSVREFDVVTLDRVRRIDVEEDYAVWKEYALRKGLHGAVVSYLDIRREHFYRMETTPDGLRFATARGWEDLSELLTVYEQLGLKADRQVIGQYIQLPRIAGDFANYLELYGKYRQTYRVEDILSGRWEPLAVRELNTAPFDERLAVMGLLLSRLGESAREVWRQDALTTALHTALTEFKAKIAEKEPEAVLEQLLWKRREALRQDREAGRTDPERRNLAQREIVWLEDCLRRVRELPVREANGAETPETPETAVGTGTAPFRRDPEAVMEAVRGWFAGEVSTRARLGQETGERFDHAFRFLEEALGQGQEMVLFVTDITAGFHTSWFVEQFGCDAYFRHNRELLFEDRRNRLREKIAAARRGTEPAADKETGIL